VSGPKRVLPVPGPRPLGRPPRSGGVVGSEVTKGSINCASTHREHRVNRYQRENARVLRVLCLLPSKKREVKSTHSTTTLILPLICISNTPNPPLIFVSPEIRNIFLSFCMVFGSSQRIDNIIFRLRSKGANEWKTNSKCYAYRSKFLYMDMDMDTSSSLFLVNVH